ncbi:hypothetical protein [Rhodococcus opacus]|uniref:hypothetical protein n=1 Tax=Rhodococcus opacus TaxID=37919 RepID=UPI001F566D5A|nr:hypothetical protein [Rhodococcus opacus]UNN05363.1 hypothetical protein MOO23_40840 [Rhodococcus opacus]
MSRSGGGRHRRRAERAAVWCAVPVALCVACAGVAQAAPSQPGTGGGSQPGTGGGSQPGTSAPAPEQSRDYLPGYTPSPNVQNSEWRQYSDWETGYQQPQYEAPQYAQWSSPQTGYDAAPSYQQAYVEEPTQSAPSVVEPEPVPAPPMVERKGIAPVEAPEGYIFTGAGLLEQPDWMPDEDRDRITNTIAAVQADAGNALTDAGVNAPQADRITGGAIGGGLLGAGIVGTGLAVPVAVLGAGVGAGIGAGIGAAVTAPTGGWGVGPGAAIGAGTGAVVLGAPAFVLGAGLGGVGGAVAGATVFGGQDVTVQEPAPAPAPESAPEPLWTPPVVDTAAVSAQTSAVVEQVQAVPGGSEVVEQARDFAASAPAYVEQATPRVDASAALVRDAALAQPGGDQVVASVESAGTNAAAAAAPVIEQAAAFAGAVVNGLNA